MAVPATNLMARKLGLPSRKMTPHVSDRRRDQRPKTVAKRRAGHSRADKHAAAMPIEACFEESRGCNTSIHNQARLTMETRDLLDSDARRSGSRRPAMSQKRRLFPQHHATTCSSSSERQKQQVLPTRQPRDARPITASSTRTSPKHNNYTIYLKRSAFSGALCLLALLCLAPAAPSLGRSFFGTSRVLSASPSNAMATTTTTPLRTDPHQVKSFAPYTTSDISRAESLFITKAMPLGQGRPALLIYDGDHDIFHTYTPPGDDGSNSYIDRLNHASHLLEQALRTNFSERFQTGQPPFQLLMSATDLPHTECIMHPQASGEAPLMGPGDGEEGCDTSTLPPILQFGSVPKLDALLPNMIAMPLPTYLPCLTEWRREQSGEDNAPSSSDPKTCRYRMAHLSHHTETGQPYSSYTQSLSWENLHPTIIWRGTDHHFLPEFNLKLLRGNEMFRLGVLPDNLSEGKTLVQMLLDRWDMMLPRWRAVALSLGVQLGSQVGYREVSSMEGLSRKDALRCDDGCQMVRSSEGETWIDAQFFDTSIERFEEFVRLGLDVVTDEWMDKDELAAYRYHIDLGGGGGTTWEGTLTKLALPGLLFHHETLTKDDYHDRMVPWEHYVPVKMDLSDLKEKFDWAEANPEEAQAIARAGTELARPLASEEYTAEIWDLDFRRRLGEVVKAYLPGEGETVETILDSYRADGLEFVKREF